MGVSLQGPESIQQIRDSGCARLARGRAGRGFGFGCGLLQCKKSFHQQWIRMGEHSPTIPALPNRLHDLNVVPVDAPAGADELEPSAALSLNELQVFGSNRIVDSIYCGRHFSSSLASGSHFTIRPCFEQQPSLRQALHASLRPVSCDRLQCTLVNPIAGWKKHGPNNAFAQGL